MYICLAARYKWFASMRLALFIALAINFVIPDAGAAVKLVRDYRLKPPRDRRVVFAMAVTPDEDVLSFIASKDGRWRLSRVKGWQETEPHEDTTVVPGLVYGERAQWNSPWSPELLVTPDGGFAVCIATAWRSHDRGGGQDEFVSVVNLAEFKVVASIHSPTIPALAGDYRLHYLDSRGHLVIEAYTPNPRHPADDSAASGSQVKLALLSLTTLAVADQCEYSAWSRTGSPTRREDKGSCAALLAHAGRSTSLSAFISDLTDKKTEANGSKEIDRTDQRNRPPQCAFLGYARLASSDGRYEREICLTSHRGFWGTPVVTKSVENIFALKTGELIGSVDEPVTSIRSTFVSAGGREYLLVLEGGTRLMVYSVAD